MLLTIFGVGAAATMVVAYAFESRGALWIAIFAVACVLIAIYGALTGAWIFSVLETVWAVIAFRRFRGSDSRPG